MTRFLLLVAALAVIGSMLPVTAHAEGVRLTKEVRRLDNEAKKLAFGKQPDFPAAIAKYEEALALTRVDALWMRLGRVYHWRAKNTDNLRQRYADCATAKSKYDLAAKAPKLAIARQAKIARADLDRFLSELPADCPGEAVFVCSPEDLGLTVDGKRVPWCHGRKVYLKPGEYTARADFSYLNAQTRFSITALQSQKVDVILPVTDGLRRALALIAEGERLLSNDPGGAAGRFAEAADADPKWHQPAMRAADAYRLADQLESALSWYRRAEPLVPGEQKASVRASIDQLVAELAKIAERKRAEWLDTVANAVGATRSPLSDASARGATAAFEQARGERGGYTTAGQITVYMGTGLAAGGVLALFVADSTRSEVTDVGGVNTSLTQREAKELEDSANVWSVIGYSSLGVGLAAVAGGTFMWLYGEEVVLEWDTPVGVSVGPDATLGVRTQW